MSTYKNGTGNVPRLPDRVVDTLVDTAGVSRCAPGEHDLVIDQTGNVHRLVHDTCEELLARLPADDARDAARYRGLVAALIAQDETFFERMEEVCPSLCDDSATLTLVDWNAAIDHVLGLGG